ncbi:uncharacterized protein LOC134232103, partial [Saccostrea cucullata]|uniref:uncharacterized protein LOC134232103 n=1 Tax=Saccostrea cuccullata TaxID=36930 RepID=UPI002ED62C4E
MTVSLTDDKAKSIQDTCNKIIASQSLTIRQLAQLIGKLVASEQGVQFAPLYYKSLEIEKDRLLKQNVGNYEARISLSPDALINLQWWINNVNNYPRKIIHDNPLVTIKTDSSGNGWGAINENSGECIQGLWDDHDKEAHINFLELKAAYLALTRMCKHLKDCHVKLYLDNTVAVTYINKMGGKIETLNELTKQFWEFCIKRNIWVTACHIAGVENVEADYLSRNFNPDMEWMLDPEIFDEITRLYGNCDIDLFASRYNRQISPYVSYAPDRHAIAIDAFTISWSELKCYIFCPFCILSRVLQKILIENVEAVIVAPIWPTQPWFPKLLQLITANSYLLPNNQQLLRLPNNPDKLHPIPKMRLGVFRVSGNRSRTEAYRRTLSTYSSPRGGNPQRNNIGHITKNGCYFYESRGKLIISFDPSAPPIGRRNSSQTSPSRGIKLLPVIKKIKGGKPDALKGFARVSKEKKTESLEFEEIEMQVNSITGKSMTELLEPA